jgi:hypothetical protein
MARLAREMPPLRGVIHAAGLLDDGILSDQPWARFAHVLPPKIEGAWNLHLATRELALDFFVLFSSIASLLGSAGQGNYAAANAFLDALAAYRRAQGLPALAINWGPWAEGMGAALNATWLQRQAAMGMGVLESGAALAALGDLLGQQGQVGVREIDWGVVQATFRADSLSFVEALLPPGFVVAEAAPPLADDLPARLARAADRRAVLSASVRRWTDNVPWASTASTPSWASSCAMPWRAN